jgi:hypothetical protein
MLKTGVESDEKFYVKILRQDLLPLEGAEKDFFVFHFQSSFYV